MKHFNTIAFCFCLFITTLRTASAQLGDKAGPSAAQVQILLDKCEVLKSKAVHNAEPNDTLYRLAKQGLALVPANDALNRSKFYYYLGLGYFLFPNDKELDSMDYAYHQSFNEAQKAKSASQIALSSIALMHFYYEMQESKQAENYSKILQPIIDTIKDKNILRQGYSALANYYQSISYYSTAQDYYLKTIGLIKEHADIAKSPAMAGEMANSCYMLSLLYLKTGLPTEAIKILKQGLTYCKPKSVILVRYYSAFIQAFCQQGNIAPALEYIHRYINPLEDDLAKKGVVSSDVVNANRAVVQYYFDHHQNNQVPFYLSKMFGYFKTSDRGGYNYFAYPVQKLAGRYYYETKEYRRAVDTLLKALPPAAAMNREDQADILKYLAMSFRSEGKSGEASRYFERYSQLQDSLTSEKLSRNFADMQTHYQTNQKTQQIELLGKDNKLKILQLKNASHQKWLLILCLAGLSLFSLLLFFFYRNKERLNKLLNERNAQLDTLNSELTVANNTKATLFGIISHDLRSPVSNILQLLRLQKENPQLLQPGSAQAHEKKLNAALGNVLETMEDLLLWSKSQMENFSPQITKTDLREIIDKEIHFLKPQIDDKKIQIDQSLPGELCQETDENFMAVILRNLLQNAIKNSVVGSVISITTDTQSLRISNQTTTSAEQLNLQLKQPTTSSSKSGLGLQIMNSLAGAINLHIYFRQLDSDTVTAVLEFSHVLAPSNV